MKKFLLILLSFGIFCTANAQFGLRGGLSSSNFSSTNYDTKYGIHFGGYYNFKLAFIEIEPGIQFSQKGYKGSEDSSGKEINERLNYLDVPVLVRVNFLPKVNVFAGPQASILGSRKYDLGGTTTTTTEVIKGYEIGGVAGLGIKLPFGMNLQASYDFGLSSLNYFNTDVKNRVLKVSLGVDL